MGVILRFGELKGKVWSGEGVKPLTRSAVKVQDLCQRSRSRRDITCAKIRKIINNSARDCSILLKFSTDIDHVTLDVPRTFKVNGSKVKVTA